MSRRRKRPEEHPNHERWLVSYADFITLLFAFFVTLYAISQVDAKKMTTLAQSMQAAFATRAFDAGSRRLSLSDGITPGVERQKLIEPADPMIAGADLSLQEVRGIVQQRLEKESSLDRVRLTQDRRGLVISLSEAGFFDSGAATMKDSSLRVLDAIAESVLPVPNQIRIEGHTEHSYSYRPVPLKLGTVYGPGYSSDRIPHQSVSAPIQPPLGSGIWRASTRCKERYRRRTGLEPPRRSGGSQ
jgi:chemotaxis protein MotB